MTEATTQTAEQAAEAAALKAAEAQAKKEAAEVAKAEKKAAADKAKAEKKEAAEKAKAEKAAAKAAEKEAKEKAKAEKAAQKAAAKPVKEKRVLQEQNGMKRPGEGTIGDRIWKEIDAASAEVQRPITIGELRQRPSLAAEIPENISSIYARWRKFNGLSGRIAVPAPAAPAAAEGTVTAA